MTEMSQTLGSIRASIERKVHASDSAGALKSAIDRAINDAYSKVMSAHEWVWSQAEGVMMTYAPITEATGGSLAVSGTGNIYLTGDVGHAGTLATVGSGWVIRDDVKRNVTAYALTTGKDRLTLSLGWPDTTAVSTYNLYAVAYDPNTLAIGKIQGVYIQKSGDDTELEYLDALSLTEDHIRTISPSVPQYYTVLRYSTMGFPVLAFGPVPDDAYHITIRYYRRPLKLVNDSDAPIVPPQWQHVIEEGALADLYTSFLHDPYQANMHKSEFYQVLRMMRAESQATTRWVSSMGPKSSQRIDYRLVDPNV